MRQADEEPWGNESQGEIVERDTVSANSWKVEQPPTTLIALWPGQSSPTETEVIAALSQSFDDVVPAVDNLESDEVLWARVYKFPNIASPVIVWAESAKAHPPGELDARTAACRWVVGFEFMLDMEDPHLEFVAMLRLLAGALESPAVLDAATLSWIDAQILADIIAQPPATPDLRILWCIHSVYGDNESKSRYWLHTHGLWRCGRPELDMLDVPADSARAAGNLINEVAEFMLTSTVPEPRRIFSIGPGLDMSLHPWQEIAKHVGDDAAGGSKDRADDNDPHGGVRAVICGPTPRGVFRKLWVWPEKAVKNYETDEAIVYRSGPATNRIARTAQERWNDLAMAFAALRPLLRTCTNQPYDGKTPVVLLKAGFVADDGDPDHREHLWFVAQQFTADTARGQLANQPKHISGLRLNDEATIHREQLTDWKVCMPDGHFGPENLPALWRSIHKLKGAPERRT